VSVAREQVTGSSSLFLILPQGVTMPSLDYRAARAAIRIRQVLDLLEFVPVSRRGDELRGPCPVHGSHSHVSRSLAVNLAKNAFHCFACGVGGNQLDLWAAVRRLPLHAATEELCQRLGIAVPRLARPTNVINRRPAVNSG
jgi:DNA primase